jgi:trehalose synthase
MMNNTITVASYSEVAPKGAVDLLYKLAKRLEGRSILHINSTRVGGGVAEILHRLIPLLNELGIKADWDVISGSPLFYKTTKSFHNGLQGQRVSISPEMYNEFTKTNRDNAKDISFDYDVVVIHDPQPAGFIRRKRKGSKWLWRCHIDISRPDRKVWYFLKDYVARYDGAIFSLPSFAQKLSIPQYLVYPSIDPLSDKNKDLSEEEIAAVLEKYAIPVDRPFILQVSRFDRFKDPVGVIEAYRLVRKYNECCLVLAGGGATDDPEGEQVLREVQEAASHDKNIFIINLPPDAHTEINALQRAATVILQKSTKEGFGLTVAEGMWKGKPVIGGAVGGITAQIIYGETGFIVSSVEGCAYRIRYLLNNTEESALIGEKAKEFTRRNFLIIRHLCDYCALMVSLLDT